MGKIYAGVDGLKVPEITALSFSGNIDKYFEECEKYVEQVKASAKANGNCPEAGKEISFPVADGCARYVVIGLKPVELVHLAIGDAWTYQYAHRLTASDIRAEIKRREALNKMFSKTPFAKEQAAKRKSAA